MFAQTNIKLNYEFLYSRFDYQNVGTSWGTFFRVDNGCPAVTKCSIFERGCNRPYTGTNLRLTNGATQIQAQTNAVKDYSEAICYSCSNARQTKYVDNIVIGQRSKCESSLSRSNVNTIFIFNYQENDKVGRAIGSGPNDFFNNAYATNCPLQ